MIEDDGVRQLTWMGTSVGVNIPSASPVLLPVMRCPAHRELGSPGCEIDPKVHERKLNVQREREVQLKVL